MNILQSKIHRPRINHVMHRERLHVHGGEENLAPVMTVIAGAGYGKTTCVAHALDRLDVDAVWYRVDELDNDLSVFLSYLIHSIRKGDPQFGEEILNRLGHPLAGATTQSLLIPFIDELQNRITIKTALVLDDLHLVMGNQDINQALDFFIERLPHHIHLVLISRNDLPLRLSKIKCRGLLHEITASDLEFTLEEIKRLYTSVYQIPIPPVVARNLLDKTGGWAASLALFRQIIMDQSPVAMGTGLAFLKGSHQDIFLYLKENVFETQASHIQELMLKTSLLAHIDPDLIEGMFGIANAGELLNHMTQSHLLIAPCNERGDTFRYHHLMRDFLRERCLKQYGSDGVKKLQTRIGDALKPHDIFRALEHFIRGGAYDHVEQVLSDHEIDFLLTGHITMTGSRLRMIPEKETRNHPQILFILSLAMAHEGRPIAAIGVLKAAHMIFMERGADDSALKCLVFLGSLYYVTGHVREAKHLMEQVLGEIDEMSPSYIVIMTYLIFLTAVLGDLESSDRYMQHARSVIADYPEDKRHIGRVLTGVSHAYRYFVSGDFYTARTMNQSLFQQASELGFDFCLPLICFQEAATHYHLGSFEEGYARALKGLDLADTLHLQDSQTGWLYLACAENCLGLNRLDAALDWAEKSRVTFESQDNRWGMAHALHDIHMVHLKHKRPGPARLAIQSGLEHIDGYGLTVTEAVLEIGLARLMIGDEDYDRALNCLVRSEPKILQAGFYLFQNHLLQARCHLETSDMDAAREHMGRALEISKEKRYDAQLLSETSWALPLLADIQARGHLRSYMETVFKEDPVLLAVKPRATIPDLEIRLMGRFRTFRQGREIPPDTWKSSKALMLLKFLASKRRAGLIHRDVLIELLWPDQDAGKTGKRFNVAMSALRKVLEPDLRPKASSSFILRMNDRYQLHPDADIRIDMEQLVCALNVAEQGGAPFASLVKAEGMYCGPFLQENPYDDWCSDIRDTLTGRYLDLLLNIVGQCEVNGELGQCIHYSEKYLASDPYHEPLYGKLMQYHGATGRSSHIRQVYERCTLHLKHIDSTPSRETVALFQSLLG